MRREGRKRRRGGRDDWEGLEGRGKDRRGGRKRGRDGRRKSTV